MDYVKIAENILKNFFYVSWTDDGVVFFGNNTNTVVFAPDDFILPDNICFHAVESKTIKEKQKEYEKKSNGVLKLRGKKVYVTDCVIEDIEISIKP